MVTVMKLVSADPGYIRPEEGPPFYRIEKGDTIVGDVEEHLPRVVMVVETPIDRHAVRRDTYYNVALLDPERCDYAATSEAIRAILRERETAKTPSRLPVVPFARGVGSRTHYVESEGRVALRYVIDPGIHFDIRRATSPMLVKGVSDMRARLTALLNSLREEGAGETSSVYHCNCCGYEGAFATVECACYDEYAGACTPKSRGPGCSHGAPFCPVCEEGNASVEEKLNLVISELEKLVASRWEG